MGAGSTPAGETPAGLDVVESSVSPDLPTLQAPLYDPAIHGFSVDAAGEHQTQVHPVIERAALLLCMRRGASPSNPDLGLNTERIAAADDDSVQNVATDEVRIALKPLLDAKDIQLVSVQVDRDAFGSQTSLLVTVANLREPGAPPVPIRRAF